MKRKVLIYTILFFILIFSNNLNVNATDCQYEVSLPNNDYFYLRINYSGQLTGDTNYYYCLSNKKLNSLCGTQNKGVFNKIEKIKTSNMNYNIESNARDTLYQDFNSNQCPNISYYMEAKRNGDYYLSFEDDSLATHHPNDYVLLSPSKVGSSGQISDDKCYEVDAGLMGVGTYNSKFCTDSNGKKYWKLQEGTKEPKKCDYKLVKIPKSTLKGIKCTYGNADSGNINFYIFESEAENIWSGNANGLKIENVDGIYYWTTLSNSNAKKFHNSKTIDKALNIYSISSICTDKNVKIVMKLLGYLLIIIKILVPILLIFLGVKSLVQTVMSGKEEDLKKTAIGLMWKIIAAIVIFILPTIINFIVSLITGATSGTSDYNNCSTCIFEPGKC